MFENLRDRAGELICAEKNPTRGHAKILQEQQNLIWPVRRYRCCFYQKDTLHPRRTSIWTVAKEKKLNQCPANPDKDHIRRELEFRPREEFSKYNYAVNLPQMANMAEGGKLHVGQLDLRTNPGLQHHARFVRWSKSFCDSPTR